MGTHLPHHKRPLRPSYLEWYEGEEQTVNMKATIVAVLAPAATAFAAPVIEERQAAPSTTVAVRGGWGMTRPWKRDEALEVRQESASPSATVRGGWGMTRPWKRDEALEKRADAPATTVAVAGGWGMTRPRNQRSEGTEGIIVRREDISQAL